MEVNTKDIFHSYECIFIYGTDDISVLTAAMVKEKYGIEPKGFIFQKRQGGKSMDAHYGDIRVYPHAILGMTMPIYPLDYAAAKYGNILLLVDGGNPDLQANLDEIEDHMESGHVHLVSRGELSEFQKAMKS